MEIATTCFMNRLFLLLICITGFTACRFFTYTPRSKKNIHREQPSIVLLNRIVDYRLEQQTWPFSREDFMSKGKKYQEAFQGFRYSETRFKIQDSNTMTFFFSGHIQDLENYRQSGKVDLNSYGGEVKFYFENDRYLWKLKMY